MKKIIIALLLVVTVIGCIGLAACSDKKDQQTINDYIFQQSGVVTDDFVLPLKIGGKDAEWSSSDSCITLEKRAEDWLAKVVAPDSGEKSVTLTLKIGKATKDYTLKVKAIDVYDIADNYVFAKDKATVDKKFALERTATYKGKEATIDWSVDEAFKDYLSISEDGNECIVVPQSVKTEVRINATFTYNGESSTYQYRMTVYVEMTGLELVDYWYSNTGVSIDMSGYIVLVGVEYSADYNNITFYMVNDDFTAGYYVYRAKCDAETGAKIVPGAHVTVTGTTNTNYNGLIETNAGGQVVVDEDVQAIDVNTTVKAIDELIIGNLPAAIYNQSRLVSLTNWTVKSIGKTPEAGKTATLFTVTKGGVDVSIAVSKYMEGAYKAAAGDAKYEAICALQSSIKVGDVVSLKGILGNYNGHQIQLLDAADVTTGGTADPDGTKYVGQDIAAAVAAVNKVITDAKANEKVTAVTEFTLPASEGEVTMTYTVASYSSAITMGEGNKVTVTPGAPEKASIRVDYKKGDFETVQFIYITSTNKVEEPEPEPEPEPGKPVAKTLAEFAALADTTTEFYILEGTVDSWYGGNEENAKKYGNFNLTDGTTTIVVYGLSSKVMEYKDGKWVNLKDFGTLGIDIGSTVKIIAAKGSYNGVAQAVGAGLYSLEYMHDAKTIAEFSALTDSTEEFYIVEGTVDRWYNNENSAKQYGNFILTDGTNELIVYGLCADVMAYEGGKWQNAKNFNTLGIDLGSKVKICAAKGSFQGTAQAVGAGLVSKQDPTDEELANVVLKGLKVDEQVTADFTLPTSERATVTWTVKEGTAIAVNGTAATVTRGSEDATVVLTATVVKGETTVAKDFTVTVLAQADIAAGTYTYDFATNFATYASAWGTTYEAHTINSVDVGTGLPEMTIELSKANKQNSGATIDNKPVLCAKSGTSYVTLTSTKTITAVTFDLQQWGTKKFGDIHIEYYNGTEWVSCSATSEVPGQISSNAAFEATQVRLVYSTTSGSNTQMGLTSISVTVA